jgi:uncharacterized protein (TIGR02594 family)
MSWHRAAPFLALACAPVLATAAQATGKHRFHHVVHTTSHKPVAHKARHHGFAAVRRSNAKRRAAGDDKPDTADASKHSSDLVAAARRYNGTNPTGRAHDWCAAFANLVLQRTGHRGSGSALARSFAHYGRPAPGPVPGAIVVFAHHVRFVVRAEGGGRIRVVSGNHGHRVGEGVYSTHRAIAYRYPA